MSEDKNINENNNQNSNEDESMAVEFPSWDLLPPDLLMKRGNGENS